MSLTSYRAAPPRDKRCAPSQKLPNDLGNAYRRRSSSSGGFLRRQPLANAGGRGGCVPTRAQFGRTREASFQDFMPPESAKSRLDGAKTAIESAVATT